MTNTYDVAILGLGAMGSAGLYQLAKAGARVIGFDRYTPPHRFGSSHGLTRVIREAYFEDPAYVPLLQRAYPLWEQLQQAWSEPLLEITGGLMIGPPDQELVQGCLTSASLHGLPHDLLNAEQVMARWPAFALPGSFAAVREPRTGFLYSERCIEAHLSLARAAGAKMAATAAIDGWQRVPEGFVIQHPDGQVLARKLVVAAGAWLPRLVPELKLPMRVSRQTLWWFRPRQPAQFARGSFPVFLIQLGPDRHLYGFPADDTGFKVALHARGPSLDPDQLSAQRTSEAELAEMRALLAQWLPEANGELLNSAVCMYTNTPDGHFLLDSLPEDPDLLLVSPCSGHGFKFSAVIGEEIMRWAQGQAPGSDLSLFNLSRLLAA